MAAKKSAASTSVPSVADLMAMLQQLQAAQAAPKAAQAAKVAAPAVDHAAVVIKAVESAGGKVIRAGKSGVSPNGRSKAWVDVKIGGVRIQGNAFVTEAK